MKGFLSILIVITLVMIAVSCSENNSASESRIDSEMTSSEQHTDINEESFETNTEPINETVESIENTESAIGGGSPTLCPLHYESYHYMGFGSRNNDWERALKITGKKKEFSDYISSHYDFSADSESEECNQAECNIFRMVKDLGWTKEEVIELLSELPECQIDPDILFSSEEDVDLYFRDFKAREKTRKRQTALLELKCFLLMEAGYAPVYFDSVTDKTGSEIVGFYAGVFEMIAKLELKKENLDHAYENYKNSGSYYCDFVYDSFFDKEGELNVSYDEIDGREQDALFCGVDNWYSD